MLAAGRGVVDPVGALLRFRVLAGGASAQGPIFLAREHGSKALAKTTVAVRLRKVLQAIGVLNWASYAANSLRR
jgi:hypothetical protein